MMWVALEKLWNKCWKMAEPAKGKPRALVIRTGHELQRHQDSMPEREEVRVEFEEHLREVIEQRNISLVAEEAEDDTEVWQHLKEEDEGAGELAILFGEGSTTGDSPVPTISDAEEDLRAEPWLTPYADSYVEYVIGCATGQFAPQANHLGDSECFLYLHFVLT